MYVCSFGKCGDVLFIDDSRNETNTSGFAFWNLILVDSEGKYAMGSMTISSSHDAVEWILNSMVEMYLPIREKAQSVLSDLVRYLGLF